jgi:hypothetical protein
MANDRQGNASVELASGLAEEIVRTFGEVRLRVFGTSMVPAILPGDHVVVRRASIENISAGEVVLFSQNGRLFVHRVAGRQTAASEAGMSELRLITRGDRLRHDDPHVTPSQLLGRVISVERDDQPVASITRRSNPVVERLLQSSDRATYFYVRLAAFWRACFRGTAKCQA